MILFIYCHNVGHFLIYIFFLLHTTLSVTITLIYIHVLLNNTKKLNILCNVIFSITNVIFKIYLSGLCLMMSENHHIFRQKHQIKIFSYHGFYLKKNKNLVWFSRFIHLFTQFALTSSLWNKGHIKLYTLK